MSSECNRKMFLVPADMEKNSKFSVISLKHPKSNSKALCAYDSSNKLFEITHYMDEFSSWLVEDSVVSDGRLFLLTVVDPLFFILPYVNKEGKFCPLDNLLVDDQFPDIHHLAKCCSVAELSNIFDHKESAGYQVFCYNNTKTLHWLQRKVSYLASCLKSEDINISDGSKASCLQTDNDKENPEILKSYACHLISDYLSEDLTLELFESLGLPMTQEKPKTSDSDKKSKKQNTAVSPTDDYSKSYSFNTSGEKQKSKLTAAQKQLMKVDKKGMKSISSFFQKK